MEDEKKVYYGWILVEDGGEGFKEYVSVEWNEGDERKRFRGSSGLEDGWRGESGCALAVEWWDRKIGKNIKLEPTLRGCYRVFTLEA